MIDRDFYNFGHNRTAKLVFFALKIKYFNVFIEFFLKKPFLEINAECESEKKEAFRESWGGIKLKVLYL